ncbi:hypothetical protein Tco_0437130, partial [Tanacetum coccineum]
IEQYQDLDEMSFEEAIGRLTAYEERINSQDTLETNDQDKLLMASSNYGKWRGRDFNKEAKESMKWKNNPNARRASMSQGTNVVSMDTSRRNVRKGYTIKTSKRSLISSMTLTLNLHCYEVN